MIPFLLTVTDSAKQSALEELYKAHGARMYSSAYKILENRQDAEDALQDTFIKIYKNMEKFMSLEGDDLILLIIIYTRNTARDIKRKRIREANRTADLYTTDDDGELILPEFADENANVEEAVINKETVKQTTDYIDSLPQGQKDVIIMKYRLGMKEKEIAQILGISETAVSSRVLRAKNGLRKMMG